MLFIIFLSRLRDLKSIEAYFTFVGLCFVRIYTCIL